MKSADLDAWLASLDDDGRLTPERIVDAARDPDSYGHGLFEWDDAKAGHLFRIGQARALLATRITVTVSEVDSTVPLYARDPDAPSGVQSYVRVVSDHRPAPDKDTRHSMLVDEFTRINSLLVRARALAAFFDMADDVDDLINRVGMIRKRFDPPQPEAPQ